MFYKSLKFMLPVFASRSVTYGFRPVYTPSRTFINTISLLSVESRQETQVFIGNLPLSIDKEKFKSIIDEYGGGYTQTRLVLDRVSGKSRGFGYADFPSKESAEVLLNSMKGAEVEGRTLRIDISGGTANRTSFESQIFIGNLDFSASKESVIDMVNGILGHGKVLKVRFAIDNFTGKPKGYGYIDFVDSESAQRALKELGGVELNGRAIFVDLPSKRKDELGLAQRNKDTSIFTKKSFADKNSNTIFLGNLSWEVDLNLLQDMLNDLLGPEQFTKIRIATNPENGKSKGFAHVDFNNEETLEKAINELSGVELLGRALVVDRASNSNKASQSQSRSSYSRKENSKNDTGAEF